ncbi:2'-5' RNA ligase family protein [Kineococcus sp. T13]|uniref:2'-5' RNA ligase family protein n=1 Tax=Kineococcus vitellinus TaxID=2696565 RepID=UPI0014129547|nr:2'-5' RNA ligase family protein [Kineococcus vitellinus]
MTRVVCAAFDADLDAGLAAVAGDLRAGGVRVPPPRHRPHLTLAGSDLPPEQVLAAVRAAAADLAGTAVHLDEAGTFRRGAVLWVGTGAPGLLAWHADVLAALAGAGLANAFPNAAPGRWRPHCTLARRVRPGSVAAAVEVVRAALPLSGRVRALAVLEVGGSGDLGLVPLR